MGRLELWLKGSIGRGEAGSAMNFGRVDKKWSQGRKVGSLKWHAIGLEMKIGNRN